MRLFRGPIRYGRELPGRPFDITAFLTRVIIVLQRKIYANLLRTRRMRCMDLEATEPDAAQRLIADVLRRPEPCLIARYGTNELETTLRSLAIKDESMWLVKFIKMVAGQSAPFWWDNSNRSAIHWVAGVFPPENDIFSRFGELVIADSREIDLLAAGRAEGEQFMHDSFFPGGKGFHSDHFVRPDSPYSWTKTLSGKRVLVISPFADSIEQQYRKRKALFPGTDFLPEFTLLTYKPVVSFGGEFASLPYKDWFEALDRMIADVGKIDFDVALVSCGAYGMNLGAAIKRMGRKAVHLGGILQAIFGLKFRGTDEVPYWTQFYTDAWARPSEAERPRNYKTIENASYW